MQVVFLLLAVGGVILSRIRSIPPTLKWPIDLEVYIGGGRFILDGQPLYDHGVATSGIDLPFTYPPFAAILFATFSWLPLPVIIIGYQLVTLFFAYLIGRWLGLPAFLMPVLMLCTQPGFSTLSFGQINIFLLTLIVADALDKRPSWLPRGSLIGIAAAIKVTPAIFVLYFLAKRDLKGVLGLIGGGAAATLLAAALRPQDTWEYFTVALPNANRVGDPAYIHNASINGVLSRLGFEAASDAVAIASVALACWVAYRASKQGKDLVALCAVASAGLLFSPISWTHHFVWLPIIAVVALREGMPKAFGWWVGIATTLGLTLTAFNFWLADVAGAQYALILIVFLLYFAKTGAASNKETTPALAPNSV